MMTKIMDKTGRPRNRNVLIDSHRSDRVGDSGTVWKTYDIGQILGTTLSTKDKFDLIQNVFKPAETTHFPRQPLESVSDHFRGDGSIHMMGWCIPLVWMVLFACIVLCLLAIGKEVNMVSL